MTNFTPAWSPDRTTFTDRERREVIVEHELLGVLLHQPVDPLFIAAGSQGHGGQGLGLSSLEDSRSMRPWQHIHDAFQVTQFIWLAAILPDTIDDHLPHHLGLQVMPGIKKSMLADRILCIRIRNDHGLGIVTRLPDRIFPCQLPLGLLCLRESIHELLLQAGQQAVILRRHELFLLHADFLCQFTLQLADFLDGCVGKLDRHQHFLFLHFSRESLDHQDRFGASGHNQVQVALLQVILRREGDKSAIDPPDSHRGDGTVKRERGDKEGRGGAVHGNHVGIILSITGKHDGLALHLVLVAFRKQRANRPVREPGG